MKVLVCVPELDKNGGVANYYRALQNHFSADVIYFTRGSRPGRRGYVTDSWRLASDYAQFFKLLSHDREIRIVHINTSFGRKGLFRDAFFILLAKGLGRRVLVFFRGWDERFERKLNRISVKLAVRAFLHADHMLVLSQELRDKVQRWGFTRPIDTESTVVDQQLMSYAVTAFPERVERTASTCIRILFLARLERAKGVYTTVDTHAALLKKFPSIRLRIAGDGSERTRLAQYIAERRIPNVDLLGYVRGQDKIDAFRSADIYLFPTTHGEGMPNSVLEAMAFGLPIVTRRVGGIVDFFRDGEMGFLTDSVDADAYVEIVTRLIENPEVRRQIARTNHEYAAEHFAAARVVGRLEAVYRQVLT
jgi:glycosyltransferase involved in cell wall biosynthesis